MQQRNARERRNNQINGGSIGGYFYQQIWAMTKEKGASDFTLAWFFCLDFIS